MFTVIYNGDPNAARGVDHISRLHKCSEIKKAEFKLNADAIMFQIECTSPITQLDELMVETEFPIVSEKFLTLGDVVLEGNTDYMEE